MKLRICSATVIPVALSPWAALCIHAAPIVVDNYTGTPLHGAYEDTGGVELTDGDVGDLVWPTAGGGGAPLVGWLNSDAIVTFNFLSPVEIGRITAWFADSDGSGGVGLPESVRVTTTGGFDQLFPVDNPDGSGTTVPINLDGLVIVTDNVTIEIARAFEWTMLAEVEFFTFASDWSEFVEDPETGLRTGTITVNGQTHTIEPNARLNGANLSGATVPFANLSGANLFRANLFGAELSGADLTGATLFRANLVNATLSDATLTGSNLTRVMSGGITGIPSALPVDWSLTGGYLIGPQADLTDADLTDANLTGADLTDADLTGADLSGADLSGANLFGADLTGANLTGANLGGVRSGDISGTPSTLPADWRLIRGYLVGPHANLRDIDLSEINLTDANLAGADLTGANLSEANLVNATLSDANLAGANLEWVRSGGITGIPSALPVDWSLISGYLVGPHAYLRGANFQNANLSGANLSGADLRSTLFRASFRGADLSGADLSGADLSGANGGAILSYADLSGADFSEANLEHVSLDYAVFEGTDLSGANLFSSFIKWTDLSGADLSEVRSGDIEGPPASLPTGWIFWNGYLIGPQANLSDANLSGANLIDADLTGADLTGANLSEASLSGVRSGGITGIPSALPVDWSLINGYLIGPQADLTDADLTDADLTDADLTDTDLSGADLTGANLSGALLHNTNLSDADLGEANLSDANLSGANLEWVMSGGITGIPSALPVDWSLTGGYLIGPQASLFDADFSGADLSGANLNGADFWSADLSGANLSGADLSGANLNGATFSGAGLSGADLSWANLFGADLSEADLSEADLSRTNLSGANLSGADLTDVISSNIISDADTILPSGYQLIDGHIVKQPAITACGFVNATTFFIEFEPAGAGHRVMSSSTLDFGNAVEVTPTLQPTSGSDNRFEFAASGSRNFYRLEPVQ